MDPMPNLFRIFGISKPTAPPTPPAQVNVIRSELSHVDVPYVLAPVDQIRVIHSELIHSNLTPAPAAWRAQAPALFPSLASITSGVTHA